MNRTVIRAVAASSAALVWSSSARAEEVPPAPAPPPPLLVAPGPPREVATWQEKSPNSGLLGSGVLMFGISYGTSVIVAAASDRSSDSALYVPIAGPWIDLANRGDCYGIGCAAEAANRVLLVTSGLFQAAGVLQIVGAFVFPETRTVTRVAGGARSRPQVKFAPSVGLGSVGLSAYGTF